jgi:hypothetical protein
MVLKIGTVITIITVLFGAWFFIDEQKLDAEQFQQHKYDDRVWKLRNDFRWITSQIEEMEYQYDCPYNVDNRCFNIMPPEASKRYMQYLKDKQFIQMELNK